MNRPTRALAIETLLKARTHADLAALYHHGMEVQVNVGRDGGQRAGDYKGHRGQSYTDGTVTWYPFRIPKSAGTEPEDNSKMEMSYPLAEHAEGVGMTGWCFSTFRSMWVAFDFDAIVGHSERHAKKLTDEALEQVRKAACNIPWVQVRKSTSGSGLHLYVFFADPIPTKNHHEHAALARSVLAMMSAIAGFDFDTKVDACGGNMWVWHRKMRGTDGLTMVKDAQSKLADIPKDWMAHLKVVKGERRKMRPGFVAEDGEATFDELAGQHPHVQLDDEHKKLIEFLQKTGNCGWWDPDHRMLVAHTLDLKRAHSELNMRGIFETISPGAEPGVQNCFAFCLRRGGWAVRRYTPGVGEAPTWEQDGRGYTKCYLNRDPELGSAARAAGGVELEGGTFAFREGEVAAKVATQLGADLKLPGVMATRPTKLKPHKDGKRLVIEMDHSPHDRPDEMEGWFQEKGKWKRILQVNFMNGSAEVELGIYDDVVRHAVTEARMDAGWFVKVNEDWHHEPKAHSQIALISLGKKKTEVDGLMGASVLKPWMIVSRPFTEEYPGDRLWNRSRVQFRYQKQDEPGEFPHWEAILNHCGAGLDDALAVNGWALANEVKKGGEYLKLWLASAFQFPYEPLPYLFMHGNQDCGKSIFHEALDLLITDDGIIQANNTLEDKERFNAELEGKVICVIEEMNLKKNKTAYERIKNWVTSPKITIHKKNLTPYSMPNTTHWVHTANDHEACPIFHGDTRITLLSVPDLSPAEMIPKPELREFLRKEAPHFLSALLNVEIPPSGSRLKVPVVSTSEKEVLAKSNRSSLEEFLDMFCYHIMGSRIPLSEFYSKFYTWMENNSPSELSQWTKHKTSKAMPPHFPIGKKNGDTCIGNLSWEEKKLPTKKLILKEGTLVPLD